MSNKTPWNVISLFDGMACGMIALVVGNLNVGRYVAYENETKYATKTASHNFPMIEQRGDVFDADFTEFEGFDLLCGGSPCTYWSIAQKNNRETEASGMGWKLFCQYVRALHEAKPRFFIYENNKSMSAAIRESITQAFGFEPICINSALVSAQNRNRLYWVGKRNDDGTYSKVDVPQPEDRGILLKDILESGVTWKNKQGTIDANYYKGGNYSSPKKQSGQRMCVAEPVCMRYERSEEAKRVRKQYEAGEVKHGFHELSELHPRLDGKSNTLSTVLKDNPICEPVGTTRDGKSYCLTEGYANGSGEKIGNYAAHTLEKGCKSMAAEPVCVAERGRYGAGGIVEQHYEPREDGKTNVLTTVQKDNQVCEPVRDGHSLEVPIYAVATEWDENGKPIKAKSYADGKEYLVYEVKDGQITIKGKTYPIKLKDGFYIIRKLTVRECMRLQTVPEWYEFPVSNSRAYQMLGNGWSIAVIHHLLRCILNYEEGRLSQCLI